MLHPSIVVHSQIWVCCISCSEKLSFYRVSLLSVGDIRFPDSLSLLWIVPGRASFVSIVSSCWTGNNVQECVDGEKSVVSSSYVWICMTGQRGTDVAVADANNLASVLDQFHVSSSHILCIAGVPGTICSWPSFLSYAYSYTALWHYWPPIHS